jgi:hypothetical protein
MTITKQNTLETILVVFFLRLFDDYRRFKHALDIQKKTGAPANAITNQGFEDGGSHSPQRTISSNC